MIYSKYINSLGKEILFDEVEIFANTADLRSYEWEAKKRSNRIIGFKKGVVKKKLSVLIDGKDGESGTELKNRIYEIFDVDVVNKKYGKLYIGDYYLNCFISASEKNNILHNKKRLELTLVVITDRPAWIRETLTEFRIDDSTPEEDSQDLDYLFDFPFDYKSSDTTKKINSDAFAPANFRMTIYGGCDNPQIYVGEHLYELQNLSLSDTEYVEIDSLAKTIEYTRYNGEKLNVFDKRNRDSYIFEKIRPENNIVSWNGNFGFDIRLYEERSEPKWI